jgi:serine/threonine protein phosphatase PrpC
MICNSIGAGDDVFIDFKEITDTVFDDDLFLLCSDGLNDMVSDEKTESLLETHANAEQLVSEAKQNGGKDNVSVALVGFKIPDVKEVETELPETHDKPNEILKEQPHSDVEYHEEKERTATIRKILFNRKRNFSLRKKKRKPDSLLGRLGKFLDGKTKE